VTDIVVFGAGSIGLYLGARLLAAGAAVSFIGRESVRASLPEGLRASDYRGWQTSIAPAGLAFSTEGDALSGAGLVLVTVKSEATPSAATALAARLPAGTPVISFQNGLHNADFLRDALPDNPVLTGMVPFNVVADGVGGFHQGTEGALAVQASASLLPWLSMFARAGLPLERYRDMRPVQWAKLLLNLNNPVNALSGIPLKQELSTRAFRRVLALAQAEALDLLAAEGISPARLTPIPPHWLPRFLDVPDRVFSLLAQRMLAIDPAARSSMWEDLQKGRRTEVDFINGEIVALAARQGRAAPVNARLVALIRDAEAGRGRSWRGDDLLAEVEAARAC
jgi:2-dehydropantoate 2-reductase